MSSSNSSLPSNSSQPSNSNSNSNNSGSLGAATYYGAVAVVVFLLIALTIASRVFYIRKAKRLAAQRTRDPEAPDNVHDNQERLAMERRGEEPGLPTYRQSVLNTAPDVILDSTPMSSHPFAPAHNNASSDTLPSAPLGSARDIAASDPSCQPPKYEDSPPQLRTVSVGRGSPDLSPETPRSQHLQPPSEMRMTSDSAITLVLPSIQIHDMDLEPDQLSRSQSPTPLSRSTAPDTPNQSPGR